MANPFIPFYNIQGVQIYDTKADVPQNLPNGTCVVTSDVGIMYMAFNGSLFAIAQVPLPNQVAQVLLSNQVVLSASNVNQLTTVPLVLVPAVASKIIKVEYVFMQYTHGSAAFGNITDANGDELIIYYDVTPPMAIIAEQGVGGVNLLGLAGFLDQTSNQKTYATPMSTGGVGVGSTNNSPVPINAAIKMQSTAGSDNTGGTGSTLTVTTVYSLVNA